MAVWYDVHAALLASLQSSEHLAGITILPGRDKPVPDYPAVRIVRGDGGGDQRLRARTIGAKKTLEIIIEAWEGSQDPDPMVAYARLADLEDKIDAALGEWADTLASNFYAHITRRRPANEELTRPAVGSQITLTIEYA